MKILPNTKYAIKAMASRYFVLYLTCVFLVFVATLIFYYSSFIFILTHNTFNTLITFLFWPILLPLGLWLLELYMLLTGKITINLESNGITSFHGKINKTVNWYDYDDVITTSIGYKIKRGQNNKLVISNLFNKKTVTDTIQKYKTENNISKNKI